MTDKRIDLAYIQFRAANAAIHQSNLAVGADGAIQTIFGPSAPLIVGPSNAAGYVSGSTYGYDVGGHISNSGINRYPFASDTDATDVGEVISSSTTQYEGTGTCSASYGYTVGGNQSGADQQ